MRLIALCALCSIALAEDLTAVDKTREYFYKLEQELWKNATNPNWINSGLGGDIELTKAFTTFADRVESIPRFPRLTLMNFVWKKAMESIMLVDSLYINFVSFVRRQSLGGTVPAPVREWLDLAEHILLDKETSVVQAIEKLDNLLQHGDLFRAALQEDQKELCDLQLSQHQLIYDTYNAISLAEIKGYAMMQFSWMLLRIYDKGNYTQEASLTRQRYVDRTVQTAIAARSALAMAKRDLHRCDPLEHEEGITFAQVTRLLQGYIENEVNMNTENTCKHDCSFYSLAENHGCYKNENCVQPTCTGRIHDCQYIDSDMWVCPSSTRTNRRYEWIEYENGRTLGQVKTCTKNQSKVDSWWQWSLLHCSYCFCLCEDSVNYSERFFSIREVLADITRNKVVTGLRLVKSGRVFHLQVSEGLLGEHGKVTSSKWVSIQKFDPLDPGIKEGIDYHTLTYERRAIDLDELDSPDDHILTGVRFRMHGAHLHFEIQSTPFNYSTGRLAAEKSQWISNDNTDGALDKRPRQKLNLYHPDIPTRGKASFPVDSKHDQYLEFTNSDFGADAAQSTVPFVDIQPVQPLEGKALLSGAGIIHRGNTGSGGFIGVKVITYNYAKHVKAVSPPFQFEEEGPEFPTGNPYKSEESPDFVPIVN